MSRPVLPDTTCYTDGGAWAADVGVALNLHPAARLVLLWAIAQGPTVLSHALVAEGTGLPADAVERHVRTLVGLGLLTGVDASFEDVAPEDVPRRPAATDRREVLA